LNIELPLLYPGFDRQRARPVRTNDLEAEEFVDPLEGKDFAGHGKGGTNYWTNEDRRPTEEEALERLEDFKLLTDIVDYLVPEEVSNNIPYWIRGPFGLAPEVAELLIKVDPLDRIQD
jgi:hypothetical protein